MRKLLLVVCLTLYFCSVAFAAGSSDFTIFWSRASPSISVSYDIVLDPSGLVILKSDTEVYGDLNVLGYLKTESDYLCDSSDCYLISDLNMYSGADGNGMSWAEIDERIDVKTYGSLDFNAAYKTTGGQPMMNKGLVDANFSENIDLFFSDFNQITNADNNTGWTLGNDAVSIVAESELKKEGEASLKVVVDVDSTGNDSSFVDLLLPEILDLNVLGLADGNISVWIHLPEGVEVLQISLTLYNTGPPVGNSYSWYEPPEGATEIRSGWVKYTQNIQEAYTANPAFDTTDINWMRLVVVTLSASDFDWYFDDIRITNYQPVDGNFNAVKAYKFFGLLDTSNLILESEDFNAAYKTTSTTYYPTALNVIYGTDQTNDINAAKYYDLNNYIVNEAAGANPLLIDINFSGVSGCSELVIREFYDGSSSHIIKFEIWDYDASEWEDYYNITGQSIYNVLAIPVFDETDHIKDGLVQVKITHEGTGVTGHVFYIDFVWLMDGINVGASTNLKGYARYNFGSNNFSGDGNFTTDGNITASNIYATDINTTADINANNYSALALKNCTVKTNANGAFYCRADGELAENQVICVKVGGQFGTCTSDINASGGCTCA